MEKNTAYKIFEELIKLAEKELLDFTLSKKIAISEKIDKSLVTSCDKEIDKTLSGRVSRYGINVISEEGKHSQQIVTSGNYLTIDPIDGSLGYIDYLNEALKSGDINTFLQKDLGPEHDFCLLLGIVEDSQPKFGACFNYITREKILIDSQDQTNLIRINDKRKYQQKYAIYVDQRPGDKLEEELKSTNPKSIIKQATLGLKSLYTILNPHQSAITCHRVQSAGLWDIMPAAVATKTFGGSIYDDNGELLRYNKYIILPGKGATVIKGEKFKFIIDKLKLL